jgi:hypothetical protein
VPGGGATRYSHSAETRLWGSAGARTATPRRAGVLAHFFEDVPDAVAVQNVTVSLLVSMRSKRPWRGRSWVLAGIGPSRLCGWPGEPLGRVSTVRRTKKTPKCALGGRCGAGWVSGAIGGHVSGAPGCALRPQKGKFPRSFSTAGRPTQCQNCPILHRGGCLRSPFPPPSPSPLGPTVHLRPSRSATRPPGAGTLRGQLHGASQREWGTKMHSTKKARRMNARPNDSRHGPCRRWIKYTGSQ